VTRGSATWPSGFMGRIFPAWPPRRLNRTNLAGNRGEESHFAGGIVLNADDVSARFSHDFDIFHEFGCVYSEEHTCQHETLLGDGFRSRQ
jgi:hypothetical protein